jgi:Ca2+-binding EF-hand superfamily protein
VFGVPRDRFLPMPKTKTVKAAGKNAKPDKHKILMSLQLKAVPMEDAHLLYTAFSVLDEDGDDLLGLEDAYTWFRATGWAWTDERLESALQGIGQDGKKFSVTELLRCADAHYAERFEIERDQGKVTDCFATFDFDNHGSLMRADLHKYLSSQCGPAECNQMLEAIGYPNNALTFTVEELARRMGNQLNEPRTPAFANQINAVG